MGGAKAGGCVLCTVVPSHACINNRDPPEPTGDEPEDFEFEAPKIYEHVSILKLTSQVHATHVFVPITDTSTL